MRNIWRRDAMCRDLLKCLLKKRCELSLVKLAAGHGEFAMPDATKPRNVAINFDVVRRIGDAELSTLIVHQESIGGPVTRIAANGPMSSQNPNLIWLGDSPSRFIQGASVIRFIRPRIDIF